MKGYSHRWLSALSLIIIGSISAVFGFSNEVWQIYLLRILTGAGAIGELLTVVMIGEITDQDSRTQGQSILKFAKGDNMNRLALIAHEL